MKRLLALVGLAIIADIYPEGKRGEGMGKAVVEVVKGKEDAGR